jgi:hypothetical protein
MADTQAIPDTENWTIAALAIAWQVVSAAYNFKDMKGASGDKMMELTNAVIKSYNAICSVKAIEK